MKKLVIAIALAAVSTGAFARGWHGGPHHGGFHRPPPIHHGWHGGYHHYHGGYWGPGGRYFWPGFVGGVVLGFYHLCPTHEAIIHIGTPNRVRRMLPQTIQLEKRPAGECLHLMDGVPAQTIGLAIRTAMGSVEPTRIREAIEVAAREQLIQRDEAVELLKEMDA